MFSSSLKPKTPSLCKYHSSHGHVVSSGGTPASRTLSTNFKLCCLTLLFTPKRLTPATHQDFIWHFRVLFIIICDAKIISHDVYSISFTLLFWWICFEITAFWGGYFLTIGMFHFFAAMPPMWLQAWVTATRAYQRRARKLLRGGLLGSCSGGGRAQGCASQGYNKSDVLSNSNTAN